MIDYKIYRSILLVLFLTFFSCEEEDFLKTEPVDFYSPSITYVTSSDYEAAVTNLNSVYRDEFDANGDGDKFPRRKSAATDIFHPIHGDYESSMSSILLPTSGFVLNCLWGPAYRIIYDANAIIGRALSDENELTAEEKSYYSAEAKFFRGNMYRMLANLYGNVPIVLEETSTPKRDYETSSREEVYQQAASDLEEAANTLGDIDEVAEHRINRLAALHMLTEVYISLGRWQDAIDAASEVIDHPATALMTERFGAQKDDKAWPTQGNFDTDVYWDLFCQGNQNRSSGNTEAIWVLQYEYNVPGGSNGGPLYERHFSPRVWRSKIPNSNGKSYPLVPKPNVYAAGRSSGYVRPTYFFHQTLWHKSGYDQDIRNSPANIRRDFIVRNPDSDYNGKWVFKDNVPISMKSFNDTVRNMYPWLTKVSTPGKQPAEAFIEGHEVEGSVTFSHRAFRDVYAIRLAETYLLRAEAYLGKGETQLAANDINTIRSRAKAPLIDASDVDIDYILDERARELYIEEFRLLTLTRLGKLVERTRMGNPMTGDTYQDHHNLWPIPYSEIEKNTAGNLEQNPGY